MADILIPDLVEETSTGIFARHPARFELPVLVAPTTEDREQATNRLRQSLVAVACANLKDYAFDFDSSFLAARSADGFANLQKLTALYPGSPLSLFGQADPVGDPVYNKFLSERRARAVFGLLLRRTAVWEQLYSDETERQHVPGDVWGVRVIQAMLVALGFTPGADGKWDAATRQAFSDCIVSLGGAVPGHSVANSPATRKVLFAAYMDLLCPPDPANPSRKWQLQPSDFLGGGQAPLGAPGDLQGCSEFNPQLLFAQEEEDDFKARGKDGKADRNAANEPNRRVVIYLFEPLATKPSTWPCPSAKAGVKGCHDRFWSDARQRTTIQFTAHRRRFGREVPEAARVLDPPDPVKAARYGKAETTFGCRFYHGLAARSPCERDLQMWVIRLWAGGPESPLANARYAATVGNDPDSPVVRGTTTASGTIGLPLFDREVTITLKVDVGPVLLKDLPPPAQLTIGDSATEPQSPDDPTPQTTDPQAWPGEDHFMTLTLQAGALARIVSPAPGPAGARSTPMTRRR